VYNMGLFNMATRNILRKINRTLLVSLALCFAIASIISVYSGIEASSAETQEMIAGYQSHLIEMDELTDIQERLIQVSGRGGKPGEGWGGGMGGDTATAVLLTQDEINWPSFSMFVEVTITGSTISWITAMGR